MINKNSVRQKRLVLLFTDGPSKSPESGTKNFGLKRTNDLKHE